jgi:hypothetical protein
MRFQTAEIEKKIEEFLNSKDVKEIIDISQSSIKTSDSTMTIIVLIIYEDGQEDGQVSHPPKSISYFNLSPS